MSVALSTMIDTTHGEIYNFSTPNVTAFKYDNYFIDKAPKKGKYFFIYRYCILGCQQKCKFLPFLEM
jgi:hypothetical protein